MEKISLRKIKDSKEDYDLLYKWCNKKEIYISFEQRKLSYEEIINKYKTRTNKNCNIITNMILYNDKPIGLVQYQKIKEEHQKIYNSINNSYEIDIFIGELKYHNKGIGTNVINIITNYLFKNLKADKIYMCPLKDNLKAINCYKKAGFSIIKEYQEKNTINEIKDYVMMLKEKGE